MQKLELSAEHLAQEVTLVLPLRAVLQLANGASPALAAGVSMRLDSRQLPPVGKMVAGEVCAGVSIDELGQPVALWLLPGEAEQVTWQQAQEWAREQDGVLPSRIDQLVLLKNLKTEFKDACYWSSEQNAADGGYAWYQHFNYGGQRCNDKDTKLRARAVRREPI